MKTQKSRFPLRGPSPGLRAWADWVIDIRKRWHESGPPSHPWRRAAGLGTTLYVLVAVIEHLLR